MTNYEVFMACTPMYMEPCISRFSGKIIRTYDGKVFATDARQMLVIDQIVCPEAELDKIEKSTYELSSMLQRTEFIKSLYLTDIKEVLDKLPSEPVMRVVDEQEDCEECDGCGEVEWTYCDRNNVEHYSMHDCPVCNGTGISQEETMEPTGELRKASNAFISIDGVIFRAEFIENLYKVATADTVDPVDCVNVLRVFNHANHSYTYQFVVGEYLWVIIAGCTGQPEHTAVIEAL